MTKNSDIFTIDDALGTSDNLAAYARQLEKIDPSISAALSPFLTLLASQPTNIPDIWNALYAATAPAEPKSDIVSSKADGAP